MSSKIQIQYYKSPVGEIILGSHENKLCLADWRYRKMRTRIDTRLQVTLEAEYIEESSEVIEQSIVQFWEYFEWKRTQFNIPLLLVGTDFQKSVWEWLLKIPYGETNSYLGLSKILGNEKAIRAVATANGANAISIIIPCHRIIWSSWDLVWYAGGLDAKKKLLELENPVRKEQMKIF